jgi:hypothetical protein
MKFRRQKILVFNYRKTFEKSKTNRRNFLKNSAILTGAVISSLPATRANTSLEKLQATKTNDRLNDNQGELLYNGIVLSAEWPPRDMKPDAYDPMPVPYLISPPDVIPIDIGRQLFVDDFLIGKTDLKREFHQPVKYESNSVLKPDTKEEMNEGYCPMAAPFSDGCFCDSMDELFKLWYMAGRQCNCGRIDLLYKLI